MQIYHDLAQLLNALAARQIPVLVLKGAHLAATVYESIALRVMTDIDILVPEPQIMAAVAEIKALGYQPETPWLSLEPYLNYRYHVPPFLRPNTVAGIELHWRVTPPTQPYTMPTAELWLHSRPVTVNGTATNGLSPEDLLLHICIHATYHHGFQHGIRALCDIAALLHGHADGFDWDAVLTRAQAWECRHGIFLALLATQQILGVEIPGQVLSALQPAGLTPPTTDELVTLLLADYQMLHLQPRSHFWQFLRSHTLLARVQLFLARIFLSPEEMAVKYEVAVNSPWRYYYYAVRFKDVVNRFADEAWRIYRRDPRAIAMVKREVQLRTWLGNVDFTEH
jgi:hypothetical protein